MQSLGFLLRALWFRRGYSTALLLVSVVTLGAAALGPVYARAVGESTLQDSLSAAGPDSGLHFAEVTKLSPSNFARVQQTVIKPGSHLGFPSRIVGTYTPTMVNVALNHQVVVASRLAWRDGYCAHLTIVTGHCPTGPGQALVSEQTITANYFGTDHLPTITVTQPGTGARTSLTIVGIYRAKDVNDPYWFGGSYFEHYYFAGTGPPMPDGTEALFVSQATLPALSEFSGEIDSDYPLSPRQIRLSELGQVRSATVALKEQYAHGLTVTTNLVQLLDRTARERRQQRTGTLLVTVQLGLLAWLVLFEVVADAVEARGNEIALAKLRGHNARRTAQFGLGEPLLFLAMAVPLGLGVAFLVTTVMAHVALVPGTPVHVPWLGLGGALVGFAGGVLAATLAAVRTLRRPVLEQWRRSEHSVKRGRASLVLDLAVALMALGGFILLRISHSRGSLPLLAPGLLILFVALLGVRLLPVLCGFIATRTRARKDVALFLASRQIGRRRAGLRLAALLAVAVGLATFALGGESVAERNRTARAHAELGADRVVNFLPEAGHDPVDAVRAADPDGTWAMAAANWIPDGGGSVVGTVLAVDTGQFASVAYSASGGASTAAMARRLSADTLAAISFRAESIALTITATGLNPGATASVQVNLRTSRTPYLNVELPRLRDGTHTYRGVVPCAQSCSLLGLTWDRPYGVNNALHGTATITAIGYVTAGKTHPIDLLLHNPNAWKTAIEQGNATDEVAVTSSGIVDRFTSYDGGYGGIRYSQAPAVLPVISTPGAISIGAGQSHTDLQMTDAFGAVAHYRVAASTPILPNVLTGGMIVDLTSLRLTLPAFDSTCNWQVWLGPRAPVDALSLLSRAGISIENSHTVTQRVKVLGRQGPALSLLLLLVCAVVGSALSVGATAVSISATSRRRSYELAALQAVGVQRRALRRSAVIEQLLLMGTAVVLGVPAGVVGAALALPVVPEFSDSTPVAMHYVPGALPVLMLATALVALLLVTAYLAAGLLIRVAVPSRLREAE